jgi:outer membrane immunogenic protein
VNVETKLAGSTALLAAAAAAASPHSAAAADMVGKAPHPVAAPSWQGFYVGGSFGASWLQSKQDDLTAFAIGYGGVGSSSTASSVGFLGGLQAGYNWQDRNFVYGIEGDVSFLTSKSSSTSSLPVGYYNYGWTGAKTSKVQTLVTLRGRFGIDMNGTMPYVTAGLALGDIKNTYTISSGYGTFATSQTKWEPGLAVGAGVEHQFSNRWTMRGEVMWVGFKDTDMNINPIFSGAGYGNPNTVKFTNQLMLGKIGLNYRF